MPTLTVYRPKSRWVWRFGTAEIQLDGRTIGELASGSQLDRDLEPGEHRLTARAGRVISRPVVVLAGAAPLYYAVIMGSPNRPGFSEMLQLVPAPDLSVRQAGFLTLYRNRPPIGYRRRTRWERIIFGIAMAAILATQVLSHDSRLRVLAVVISIPAIVAVVTIWFRTFLYHPDRGDDR